MRNQKMMLGELALTRVEYMSLPVPAELLGIAPDQLAQVSWAEPAWVTEGQIKISAAAWFAEAGGKRIVFDPVQTTDVLLRADEASEAQHQTQLAAAFTESGFALDSIDLVLMTHIEDVGAVATHMNGEWQPFFPNAKILLSAEQLKSFVEDQSETTEQSPVHDAWLAMIHQGRVDTYSDGETLLPGVVAEVTNRHQVGHSVFHLNDKEATFIGHLAVTPMHLATGPCEALNEMPEAAFECLQEIARDGRKLIGPLWPGSGVGRWMDNRLHEVVLDDA